MAPDLKIRPLGMIVALCITMGLTSSCSEAPKQASTKSLEENWDSDPLEPMNRGFHRFNYVADGLILRPVTSIYRGVVPEDGREMVSNFLDNLYSPVEFSNSVLQGDPENSFTWLWRFLINSTFGVAGLFDPATHVGLKARHTDFGQTLALWGVDDTGAYLVLPLFGPSNVRDGIGRGVDTLMNPITYTDASYYVWGANAIDWRSNNMELVDNIYRTSIDPYATFRSGYLQKRSADIRRAKESRQKAWKKAGFIE